MQKSTTQKVEYSRFTFAENTTSNHQNSWEPGFWGVMDSLVLLAYASLAASRIFLQRLLACLNFSDLNFTILIFRF